MATRRRVPPPKETHNQKLETPSDPKDESGRVENRPDKPCHKPCESLLSSGSGFHNYRGLLNNCIILLVLSNSHNVIHNLIKYGILVKPSQLGSRAISTHWILWCLFLISYIFPVVILIVEKITAKGYITDRILLIFYGVFFSFLLLLPASCSFLKDIGPTSSFFALAWYTIIWLKLVSYAQVNWWCRKGAKKNESSSSTDKLLVRYPQNLTLGDMVYFICAPTLCYELNFPRNKKIRKIFMLRRFLEAVFILNVNVAVVQQWIIPTALNSLQPFKDMEWVIMVERVFLLALPNHLFWLLGFYLLFHSIMNFIGELLCFGDRRFYDDWWNAQSVGRFWKTWNIPVHNWAVRHVYRPLTNLGYSRLTGQLIVFLLSAFFHEYLVSLPLQMIRPWAFVGIVAQFPLGILTSFSFAQGQIGNVIVWCSIILGQPVAIIMYLHDYYWLNWSTNTTPSASTISLG